MARRNRIFNGITKIETTVPLTVAEEKARDQEEQAVKKAREEERVAETAHRAVVERIGSDTATLKDVLAYLRFMVAIRG